jgi:hypothetical protein
MELIYYSINYKATYSPILSHIQHLHGINVLHDINYLQFE